MQCVLNTTVGKQCILCVLIALPDLRLRREAGTLRSAIFWDTRCIIGQQSAVVNFVKNCVY